MKPTARGNEPTDKVQCSACKKHLDFDSAQVTELGWKKLGSERRAAWRCASCKLPVTSPTLPTSPAGSFEPATIEVVLKEIKGLKTQLAGLPALIVDVKTIKDEISDLKASSEFTSEKIRGLTGKVSTLENRVTDMEQWEIKVGALQSEVALLRVQTTVSERRSRLNNVEIKGVPMNKGENLFTIVEAIGQKINCPLPKAQINYLYRVPIHNSKEKSIIVSFINRYMKEEFVAAARAYKTLTASEIGFRASQQRVFVNDHLTGESKNLLTKTKALAKEKRFSYVWVKFGKIHVRKNDTSQILVITKDSDLNKIV